MPAADFHGLDSVPLADDTSVATFFLQKIRESVQFIEDERLPQVGHIYRIHYDDAGSNLEARLPRWHAAQWVSRGPFLLWVPKHIETVSMSIRYLRDNEDVRCVAYSYTKRGIVQARTLQQEHDNGEPWTGTFTSSTEAVLTLDGIEVKPNAINMIWLGFISDRVPHPGTNTPDQSTDAAAHDPPDQMTLDDLGRYAGADQISSTPERWLQFSSSSPKGSPPVEDGATYYTITKARYDNVNNVIPISVILAEHAYGDMPPEIPSPEDAADSRGYALWGDLGVVQVYGIGFDLTSGISTDFRRAFNLRWFQPPGLALLQLVRRIKEAHFIRQPAQRFEPGLFNYGSIGSGPSTLLFYYPGHWRVFHRNLIRPPATPGPTTVYEWSYRHSSSFHANHTPLMKVAFCALYVSEDMQGGDSITVAVEDIAGVVQASETISSIEFASITRDEGSWLRRWIRYVDRAVNLAGDMLNDGASFGHDGMTPPWEVDRWPLYEVEVDISGLVADSVYRCRIDYATPAGSTGTTCFGGLHVHTEGNNL